jgi:hypothetical protein
MYMPIVRGKKRWVAKDPICVGVQHEVASCMRAMGLEKSAPSDVYCYRSAIKFRFERREWITDDGVLRIIDLTNLWKPIEDAIFKGININRDPLFGLGVDDSKCVGSVLLKDLSESTPPYTIDVSIRWLTGKVDPKTFDMGSSLGWPIKL